MLLFAFLETICIVYNLKTIQYLDAVFIVMHKLFI